MTQKEKKILSDHIEDKGLRHSQQRLDILAIFLKAKKHLSPEELYRIVRKRHPKTGYATIYRTLRLFCECGLARELKFNDGVTRFEPQFGYQHHDHLICTKCERLVEVLDPEIERLQEKLVKKHGFHLKTHRMEMYGICRRCNR